MAVELLTLEGMFPSNQKKQQEVFVEMVKNTMTDIPGWLKKEQNPIDFKLPLDTAYKTIEAMRNYLHQSLDHITKVVSGEDYILLHAWQASA